VRGRRRRASRQTCGHGQMMAGRVGLGRSGHGRETGSAVANKRQADCRAAYRDVVPEAEGKPRDSMMTSTKEKRVTSGRDIGHVGEQ